jgi:hypothetical protein
VPDDLGDWLLKLAIGAAAALGILGPAIAMFIRHIRGALAAERQELAAAAEEQARLTAQRSALVVGHLDVLDELDRSHPATARLVREKLRAAQDAAGVQSDVAKVVDDARAIRANGDPGPHPPAAP